MENFTPFEIKKDNEKAWLENVLTGTRFFEGPINRLHMQVLKKKQAQTNFSYMLDIIL